MVPLLTLAFTLTAATQATAQLPYPNPAYIPQPVVGFQAPPLLFVKLVAPKGTQATIYRGNAQGLTFDLPITLGLRPGFRYRLALHDVPGYPLESFHPTFEVRGSLLLGNKLKNAEFPAVLTFTAEDFAKIKRGVTHTKVVVLERPETAIPQASSAENPIEIEVPLNRDPLEGAREKGLPVLVMHLGERKMTRYELMNEPGTMLLPGERVVPMPRIPPYLAWQCFPAVDPLAGPAPFGEFVIVPDGGDIDIPAGFNREGRLKGLDPSDTVAEYEDSKGRKRLARSNRVGLCIPRFLVLRSETILWSQIAQLAPGATRSVNGFGEMTGVRGPQDYSQKMQLEGVSSQVRPSGSVQTLGVEVTGRVEGVAVTASMRWIATLDGSQPTPAAVEPPDCPLVIIKWPDRTGAKVGDLIMFTVRYSNNGGQPISNVVVSDSLTTRFEYVPGSAKADREAIFTTQPNEAGSLILRWEMRGVLLPRESGVVQFQVRVR